MTQKEIIDKCKLILQNTKIDGFVENQEDFNFLLFAFGKSLYYEMKTQGKKIKAIQKKRSHNYGTCCFYLIRSDGSQTDISYSKIFRKDPQYDDLLQALRNAIEPIIRNFRETFKPFEYEGRLIQDPNEVDVDHYNLKFKELASIWIEQNGGIEELSKYVNDTIDGSTTTFLTDDNLKKSFVEFHNANTNLRFLPKSVNRSIK